MAEDEEKDWLRIILPRVLKAVLWSSIMGIGFLIPLNLIQQLGVEKFIPAEYGGFSLIVAIFIALEFAVQLLSGTVLHYALSVTRTVISMVLLIVVTDMGMITTLFEGVQITLDFSSVLAVLLALSLLNMAKNILQALDFLSEKAEEPVRLVELP